MLIVPLTGKMSLKNPPIATITIILINCFVFFVLQSNDNENYAKAMDFYHNSGLVKIEVSNYINYLAEKGNNTHFHEETIALDEKMLNDYYPEMMGDREFMSRIERGDIITPKDRIYPEWKNLRSEFDALMNQVFSYHYGFIPSRPAMISTFTHMFTHGSFMHLLGNMVFLWLVGCVLELGCGRLFYMALYIFTGIGAVGLYSLAYATSVLPLIGASGAISGLMGAYTVIYGLKKIKVFYSFGFYFNYSELPAIILLPLWIVNEILQLFFGGPSNVAYVAHIGGLLSGAFIGLLNVKLLKGADATLFEQDPHERIPSLMESALKQIGELDMKQARLTLEDILKIDSHHREALRHLFNIDKLHPETDTFHQTASKLLSELIKTKGAQDRTYETFNEYRHCVEELKLNADLLFSICSFFSFTEWINVSEEVIEFCLEKYPNHPQAPIALLNIARANLKLGHPDKSKRFLKIIHQNYPLSKEESIADHILAQNA